MFDREVYSPVKSVITYWGRFGDRELDWLVHWETQMYIIHNYNLLQMPSLLWWRLKRNRNDEEMFFIKDKCTVQFVKSENLTQFSKFCIVYYMHCFNKIKWMQWTKLANPHNNTIGLFTCWQIREEENDHPVHLSMNSREGTYSCLRLELFTDDPIIYYMDWLKTFHSQTQFVDLQD